MLPLGDLVEIRQVILSLLWLTGSSIAESVTVRDQLDFSSVLELGWDLHILIWSLAVVQVVSRKEGAPFMFLTTNN
jgi:hypothetical protein